jgi:hypothetical protein
VRGDDYSARSGPRHSSRQCIDHCFCNLLDTPHNINCLSPKPADLQDCTESSPIRTTLKLCLDPYVPHLV